MNKDVVNKDEDNPLDDMNRIENLINANHEKVKHVLENKDNQEWFHVDVNKK